MTDVATNDFAALFTEAPLIHTVFFNGQTAAALFRKLVLPELNRKLMLVTLPSTSPAHASVPAAKKKAAWSRVRTALK